MRDVQASVRPSALRYICVVFSALSKWPECVEIQTVPLENIVDHTTWRLQLLGQLYCRRMQMVYAIPSHPADHCQDCT